MTTSLRPLDGPALETLFTGARTANSFAATTVTDGELAAIWDLAKWPPTAANVQPLRVVFVREEDGRSRVLSHMDEGNVAKTSSAPVVAILALDTRFHDHIPTVLPFRPELREVFAGDDSMRENVGSFNGALQAGYFVMAVRALGLAAGPMAGFDRKALDNDFFPDGRWESILVVNIGHPSEDAWFDRLPRLDATETVKWA
ncbi:malonic semialdehyde reductase [Rhodococcus erythropolis]|uniref:malonic semialdehyde reductase n=1 Tax=Rhodococcus erythropolis TaxID=1833 RepID=UPI0019803987|nr:malonic semialdehyde reductase [Rhodococcus erythropolis]QSE41305.1 malonic semialdehyde reductase [Rhodococcus erythropolis]